MTSLREAVERLRAWQNSVDKPSADHKFLADVQLVLDSLTPTEDVRQQISDIIVERLGDAVPPVECGVVDAIAEFVTSREQAKDAEIAKLTEHLDWHHGMTDLQEAVERLREAMSEPSWLSNEETSVWIDDLRTVLAHFDSPPPDVREAAEKIVADHLPQFRTPTGLDGFALRDAIATFVTERDKAKDAEIAKLTEHLDWHQNAEADFIRANARLAARLEKANGIINDLLGLPLDNGHACVVDLVSEHVDAATEFLEGWSPDGSTTVPARETALHDGTEGE